MGHYLDGFELSSKSEVENLIDKSITERYTGELDRSEGRHGEIVYQPTDTDDVIELLVALWGELLTPEAINEAFDRLMEWEYEWPHGYCEADEAERPLSDFYTEEDAAADWFEAIARGQHSGEI